MAKYSDLTLGQVEAIINKIGGESALRSILRGIATVSVSLNVMIKPWLTVQFDSGSISLVILSPEQLGTDNMTEIYKMAEGAGLGYPPEGTANKLVQQHMDALIEFSKANKDPKTGRCFAQIRMAARQPDQERGESIEFTGGIPGYYRFFTNSLNRSVSNNMFFVFTDPRGLSEGK